MSLSAAPVRAEASRQALNRCSDAAKTMRSAGRKQYQGQPIGPNELKQGMDHFRQVVSYWKRAQAQIQQVPAGELDWKDPRIQECKAEIAEWQAYVVELQGKLKSAGPGAAALEPFLAEVKPYKNSFMRLLAAKLHPEKNIFNGLNAEAAGQMRDEMAKVADLCAEKFPDAGASEPTEPERYPPGTQFEPGPGVSFAKSLYNNADTWCWVAKNRQTLLSSAAGNAKVIVEGYGDADVMVPVLIKNFSRGATGMDVWVASILTDPAAYFEKHDKASAAAAGKMGVASAGSGHARLEGLLEELQGKVDASAPTVKFRGTGGRDSRLEKDAAGRLKAAYPSIEVVATGMHADGWTISKNELGVPLSRYRSGSVAFKTPGAKWCQQRDFNWVETYSGGGNYEPPTRTNFVEGTEFLVCP